MTKSGGKVRATATEHEFTCPKCKGHTFGTITISRRGFCTRPGCSFSWNRDKDDAKYINQSVAAS